MRIEQIQFGAKRQAGRSSGFSLIELLIVVAIILIIAAISVPNLIRAKMAANEAATVENLRTISTANVAYSSTYDIGFAAALSNLAPPPSGNANSTNAGLIDSVLASGVKSGYTLIYTAGPPDAHGVINSYTATADPTVPGYSGQRHFFIDQSGIIRANAVAPATVNDMPIQ